MALPDDLSLPTPPPPNPPRREAAVVAAVSRFEVYHGRATSPPVSALDRPVKRWAGIARPQLAAFATVALVTMVSVPLWIEHAPPLAEPSAVPSAAINLSADVAANSPAPAARAPDAAAAPVAPRFETPPTAESATPPSPVVSDKALAPQSAQKAAADRLAVAVREQVVAAPPPPAALANSAPAQTGMIDDSSIVVTGSRVGGSADGEVLARRDLRDEARHRRADSAISALDRKIEQAPSDVDAYLRRGEKLRRKGELARALADLDRAVRLAPRSARAYYERSLVLRRLNLNERAEIDERRAIELDRRYDAIIP